MSMAGWVDLGGVAAGVNMIKIRCIVCNSQRTKILKFKFKFKRRETWAREVASAVTIAESFYRVQGTDSQHLHGSLFSTTAVPEDPVPSPELCEHTSKWCTYTSRQNSHLYKIKVNKSFLK